MIVVVLLIFLLPFLTFSLPSSSLDLNVPYDDGPTDLSKCHILSTPPYQYPFVDFCVLIFY